MDFLQAFTDCWWPGSACRPRWEAWAALGAWAAAAATFLAVLLPFARQRAADRLRAEVAVADVMPELWRLAVRVREIRSNTARRSGVWQADIGPLLVLNEAVPTVEAIPELRGVLIASRGLRASISQWNLYARLLASRYRQEEPLAEILEGESVDILLRQVEQRVQDMAKQIGVALPILALEADRLVSYLSRR